MTIKRITGARIERYPDTGQIIARIDWLDPKGKRGATEGRPSNAHMRALLDRAEREGLTITKVNLPVTPPDNLNSIDTWAQGQFIDGRRYDHASNEWKQEQRQHEALLVRPGPLSNAICTACTPEFARWIAARLNYAARAETAGFER